MNMMKEVIMMVMIIKKIIYIYMNILFNRENSEINAAVLVLFEYVGAVIVIMLLYLAYEIINNIIKCINDTKLKLNKDLDEYECMSVS